MATKVGTKGQVVIDKQIRDRLGIGPGWIALQKLVDDHVEIYFVGPEHNRSLKGSLAKYTDIVIQPGEEWNKAREQAWEAAARERVGRWGQEL
ncbi:MAG: AbrB family transcriptional regulator [SAR202 cluster bacterium Io17-Chloro-G9]|nr:MAG: AbrB family transcriptional regulator [SAR202 cluster bacterium Io17-Chloro-G9]